jgi:hypothetical protein
MGEKNFTNVLEYNHDTPSTHNAEPKTKLLVFVFGTWMFKIVSNQEKQTKFNLASRKIPNNMYFLPNVCRLA